MNKLEALLTEEDYLYFLKVRGYWGCKIIIDSKSLSVKIVSKTPISYKIRSEIEALSSVGVLVTYDSPAKTQIMSKVLQKWYEDSMRYVNDGEDV